MAWKRYLARAIFLAVLAAIGYGVHLLLPPAPRWTLEGPFEILGITADSKQFWTVKSPSKDNELMARQGPLRLRNMNNGEATAEFLTTVRLLGGCRASPSGRFVAAYDAHANCMHIVDGEGNQDHRVPLPEVVQLRLEKFKKRHGGLPASDVFLFSSDERHVTFSEDVHVGRRYSVVVDTTTGKIKSRFVNAESIDAIVGDGSYALFSSYDAKQILWDIVDNHDESKRLVPYGRRLPYGGYVRGNSTWTTISPTGRHFLTSNGTEVALCDSITWKLRKIPSWHDLSFSPSGRFLIDEERVAGDGKQGKAPVTHHRITLFDAESGKRLGSYEFEGTGERHRQTFSSDESMCLLITSSPAEELFLEARRLPDGTRLWRKPVELPSPLWSYQFTANNSLMFAFDDTIEIWDGQTGEKKATVWKPNHLGTFRWAYQPVLCNERRLLHCIGLKTTPAGWWDEWASKRAPWLCPTGMVLVADANAGQILFNLPVRSFQPHDAVTWLSEDGQTLIFSWMESETGAWHHSAYDIPARPRWGWVVGVPLGLGGLVLGWRRWRQRKKLSIATAN